MPPESEDIDWETDSLIRSAALRWLEDTKRQYPDNAIPFAATKITLPQPIKGQFHINALSQQNGIWKPKPMQACLSVLSSHQQIYDDYFNKELGVISYKYREHGGYNHSDNRSLRLAMKHQLPVLYFQGIDRGLYQVDIVRIIQESPSTSGGNLANASGVEMEMLDKLVFLDGVKQVLSPDYDDNVEQRIHTTQQMARLHQAEFRHRIMRAYRTQCAVCRFKKKPLLDAAHIMPHSQGGREEVPNGLSLCKIHHGAYDKNILGIDPDYRIHINEDMLKEKDGPMLEHGFQKRNAEEIHTPKDERDLPDKAKLAKRFEEFHQAS